MGLGEGYFVYAGKTQLWPKPGSAIYVSELQRKQVRAAIEQLPLELRELLPHVSVMARSQEKEQGRKSEAVA